MSTLDDLRAWCYAVDRKFGDRAETRLFIRQHSGRDRLHSVPRDKYDELIEACQMELGTTHRPPDVDKFGKIICKEGAIKL